MGNRAQAARAEINKLGLNTNFSDASAEVKTFAENLKKLNSILINLGTKPTPNAFGGRVGFDTQLAMLRKGEMVMNPMAVRRHGAQLDDMNKGTTINFGDINLTSSAGRESSTIVRSVINELKKLDRLGIA
jgi:hypothetical protein